MWLHCIARAWISRLYAQALHDITIYQFYNIFRFSFTASFTPRQPGSPTFTEARSLRSSTLLRCDGKSDGFTSWRKLIQSFPCLQQRIIPRQKQTWSGSFSVIQWDDSKIGHFVMSHMCFVSTALIFWASHVPLSKDNELAVRAAATVSAATGLGRNTWPNSGRLGWKRFYLRLIMLIQNQFETKWQDFTRINQKSGRINQLRVCPPFPSRSPHGCVGAGCAGWAGASVGAERRFLGSRTF